LPIDRWHRWIGDAGAILDRQMRRMQRIDLTGESMSRPAASKARKPTG
jgi:hypothetical protein